MINYGYKRSGQICCGGKKRVERQTGRQYAFQTPRNPFAPRRKNRKRHAQVLRRLTREQFAQLSRAMPMGTAISALPAAAPFLPIKQTMPAQQTKYNAAPGDPQHLCQCPVLVGDKTQDSYRHHQVKAVIRKWQRKRAATHIAFCTDGMAFGKCQPVPVRIQPGYGKPVRPPKLTGKVVRTSADIQQTLSRSWLEHTPHQARFGFPDPASARRLVPPIILSRQHLTP